MVQNIIQTTTFKNTINKRSIENSLDIDIHKSFTHRQENFPNSRIRHVASDQKSLHIASSTHERFIRSVTDAAR